MVSKWFKLISSRTTTLALSKFNLRVYQETLLFLNKFITLFSSLQVAPDKNGKALWKSNGSNFNNEINSRPSKFIFK
jgi:hypothetical protein